MTEKNHDQLEAQLEDPLEHVFEVDTEEHHEHHVKRLVGHGTPSPNS